MANPINIEEILKNISQFAPVEELFTLRQLSVTFYRIFAQSYFDKKNIHVEANLEKISCNQTLRIIPHIYRTVELNPNIFYIDQSYSSSLITTLGIIAPFIKTLYLDMCYVNPFTNAQLQEFIKTLKKFKYLKSCTIWKFKWEENIETLLKITKSLKDMKVKEIKIQWKKGIPTDFAMATNSLRQLKQNVTNFEINCKHAYSFSNLESMELASGIVLAKDNVNLEFEGIRLFIQESNFPERNKQKFSQILTNLAPCVKSISFQILRQNPSEWAIFPMLQNPTNWTKLVTLKIHGSYETSFKFINDFPNLKNLYLINLNWNKCLFPNNQIKDSENLKEIFGCGKLDKLFIFHGKIFCDISLNGFNKLNATIIKLLKTLVKDVKVTTCIIDLPHNI